MARSAKPRAIPRRITFWTILLFVLRFGGLAPLYIWLLAGLGGGAWYAFEVYVARPPMAWMGLPQVTDWKNPMTWNRTLRNHGFLVGYSDLRGNPLWVTYALTPPPADAPRLKRPAHFSTDWRGINRVSHEDYTKGGYDRGHMAPNHAISTVYGREGQLDTFLMTNVTPQKANLNEKLWERLEELELDQYAKQFGRIWVVTGPIFDPPLERMRSSWRVEIPDAFYKIIVAPEAKKMLAFIMPQTVRGDEPLDHYLTSVDAIEKRTGLDFFQELDDPTENRLEAEVDPESWRLQALARLPGRYSRKSAKEESGDTP
ncbi:MAG: DNA/RNA non-specific endonuclease [Methylococcaceae bacterium]|nr:DNA/RNA non-specific endonuclease [Methylococcaceae bacterium]